MNLVLAGIYNIFGASMKMLKKSTEFVFRVAIAKLLEGVFNPERQGHEKINFNGGSKGDFKIMAKSVSFQ